MQLSVGSVSYPRAMDATATRDMAASFSVEQQVGVQLGRYNG